jgi:hypothetical protein
MYIQSMANSKRDKNSYIKKLDRYSLNRADIIAIEKMLRVYGDAREMKVAGVSTLPADRKHMPRKYVDRHIKIGRYKPFSIEIGRNYFGWSHAGVENIYDADSVKFLDKSIKKSRYVEIACRPGIAVTFTPLTTTIYAQTNYATGNELKLMKEVVVAIEEYLLKSNSSFLNLCKLNS